MAKAGNPAFLPKKKPHFEKWGFPTRRLPKKGIPLEDVKPKSKRGHSRKRIVLTPDELDLAVTMRIEQNLSFPKIGKEFGVSGQTMQRRLTEANLL